MLSHLRFSLLTREQRFTEIYLRNRWCDSESHSGPGSTLARTQALRDALCQLLKDLRVRSVVDLGCGDFNWMKELSLDVDMYVGADIVPSLIETNQTQFGNQTRRFVQLDMARDNLPSADLILCRDCLVHLSLDHIRRALDRICGSNATYLLATTFTATTINRNILTGHWRPLNLQETPFRFPLPVKLIADQPLSGEYPDKCLALWRIDQLASHFHKTNALT